MFLKVYGRAGRDLNKYINVCDGDFVCLSELVHDLMTARSVNSRDGSDSGWSRHPAALAGTTLAG